MLTSWIAGGTAGITDDMILFPLDTLKRRLMDFFASGVFRLAWTLTKKEEQAPLIFERKIFRRLYGPKFENGEWKSWTNRELEEISKGKNMVKCIKGQRISWLGHLGRMEEDRMPKKRKTQEKMERGSRKSSSSAGSEKMERVGGR